MTQSFTFKVRANFRCGAVLCCMLLCCANIMAQKRTFTREYTYQGGEADSKLSARAIAATEMRNILLREVGEYLHAERRSENGEYSEKINAITAGIVEMKVLDEKWDGNAYRFYIRAQMSVDPQEVNRRITEILGDKQKTKELEDARRRIDKAEADIEMLKKELAKKPDNQAAMQKYTAATNKLTAEEYFTKGNNARENGFYELAIEYYQKAIEINPNDAAAYYNMGLAYGKQQNYPQAIRCYQKAIEIDPNYAAAYNNMGNAYAKQKNYPQAIRCYQKAIDINTKSAKAYNNMGIAYYEQKNYPQAIRCYQKAIDIDTNYAAAYYNMGNVYAKQENYLEAIRCYQKAIDIDPNYAAAYNDMSYAYAHMKNYTKALECIRKSLEIAQKNDTKRFDDSDVYNFWDSMGEIYFMAGNMTEAVKWYRKAAQAGLENSQKWLKEHGYDW